MILIMFLLSGMTKIQQLEMVQVVTTFLEKRKTKNLTTSWVDMEALHISLLELAWREQGGQSRLCWSCAVGEKTMLELLCTRCSPSSF